MATFWRLFGDLLATFWRLFGDILVTFWRLLVENVKNEKWDILEIFKHCVFRFNAFLKKSHDDFSSVKHVNFVAKSSQHPWQLLMNRSSGITFKSIKLRASLFFPQKCNCRVRVLHLKLSFILFKLFEQISFQFSSSFYRVRGKFCYGTKDDVETKLIIIIQFIWN